jgi:glutathione S-transferase
MFKLYFTPGACSLAPHIALREAGLSFELEQVDLETKRTRSGADFTKVNPKGQVPVLQLEDGALLTEVPVVLQYIADRKPETDLAPRTGTMERYRLQEWLNFATSELHKGFTPLFRPDTPAQYTDVAKRYVTRSLAYLDERLAASGSRFLLGDTFTVADIYVFVVASWSAYKAIDLAKWPALAAYSGRVAERAAVQKALEAEGLKK